MRRITVIVVGGLLLAAGCSDDGGSDTEEPSETTTAVGGAQPEVTAAGGPTLGPLVSGTSSIVDGTYVWTDYVYDDRGPNEDGEPGGDAVFAEGWRNEADLVQLQLGLDDEGRVTVRAVLETLTDATVPVLHLGFDRDPDLDGGFLRSEPADAPMLGIDTVASLRQEDSDLAVTVGVQDVEREPLEVTVDVEANTIEATLPLEPDGAIWPTAAAVGVEGPTVDQHDLAFIGDEPEYRWQDDLQADVLGANGDLTAALAEIDFGALADGGTELADATSPGFHTYLYESELDLGESVAQDAEEEDGLEYRGPYQPYLVYVPDDGLGESPPMTLFLHGLTQNHLGSVITPDGTHIGTGRPLSEEIDNLAQYAVDGLDFPPHNLTVWPLARGEGLRYRGIAEQDAMDVLDDATARFAPDPDRIILSGASMGGIGSFRLGALYPDRFSVVAPIIGLASDDTVPLLSNLRNVPIRQLNGAADPLIPADAATATTDVLDDLELEYRAWMIDGRGHEAGGFVYDCVYESLPEFERVTAPPDVRYTIDPEQFVSDADTGLELSYDGAYWAEGMVLDDDTALGGFEGHRIEGDGGLVSPVHTDERGRSGPRGGDLCGPNPDVSTGDTWRERAVEWELGPSGPPMDPEVQVELTNLSSVTIDIAGVGLDAGNLVRITADTAGEVTLTGMDPGVTLTVGAEALAADDDGTVTFSVEQGETTATLG